MFHWHIFELSFRMLKFIMAKIWAMKSEESLLSLGKYDSGFFRSQL